MSKASDLEKFNRAGRRVFKLLRRLKLNNDMVLQILGRAVAVTLPDLCNSGCEDCFEKNLGLFNAHVRALNQQCSLPSATQAKLH